MKIDEVIAKLKQVPTENLPYDHEILAEALIIILEAIKDEKVTFT